LLGTDIDEPVEARGQALAGRRGDKASKKPTSAQ